MTALEIAIVIAGGFFGFFLYEMTKRFVKSERFERMKLRTKFTRTTELCRWCGGDGGKEHTAVVESGQPPMFFTCGTCKGTGKESFWDYRYKFLVPKDGHKRDAEVKRVVDLYGGEGKDFEPDRHTVYPNA